MTRLSDTSQFQAAVIELMTAGPPGCNLAELRRAQFLKVESLLPRTRPFSILSKGPPARNPGDPPLRQPWAPLASAMMALMNFGTLCLHLQHNYKSSSASWQYLIPHIPVVTDWLEFVLPTNGNLVVTSNPLAKVYCASNVALTLLRGLCQPGLHGEDEHGDRTSQFMSQTPILSWLVDLWLHFDDHEWAVKMNCTHQITVLLCNFGYGKFHSSYEPSSPTMTLPGELVSLLRQKSSRRNLCHVYTKFASTILERPELESYASDLFVLGCALLETDLAPKVYPREALKVLLHCLDRHVVLGHYDTAAKGFCYLTELWRVTTDHRTLQWSLAEGILSIVWRVLMSDPPPALVTALQFLGIILQQSLVLWRILDSFRRLHDRDMPLLRILGSKSAIIGEIIARYNARIPQFLLMASERKEQKSKCSHYKCPASETRVPSKPLRACACKAANYCSLECQRQDWKQHRPMCVSWRGHGGYTTASDIGFIIFLARDYFKKNVQRIYSDACAIDPLRTHQLAMNVDLRFAAITHTVEISGPPMPSEDAAWRPNVFAEWFDGAPRTALCGSWELLGGREEAA